MLNLKRSLLIVFAIVLIAQSYVPDVFNSNRVEEQIISFQKTFIERENEATEGINQLIKWHQEGEVDLHSKELVSDYYSKGISYFIWEKDKIIYWSEDASIVSIDDISDTSELLYSGNAIHYKISVEHEKVTYLALVLLKNNYDIENDFLESKFQTDFQYPSISNIIPYSNSKSLITNAKLKPIFSLEIKQSKPISNDSYFLFILFLLGIFLLFFQLTYGLKLRLVFLVLLAFLLRALLLLYRPQLFDFLPIFHSQILVISDLIPSLGDLLLHALLIFYLAYSWIKELNKNSSLLIISLLTVATFFIGIYLTKLIALSVQLSQINFNLNNLFTLDHKTILALFSLGLIMLAVGLLIRHAIHWWVAKVGMQKVTLILLLFSVVCLFLFLALDVNLSSFWTIPLAFLFLYKSYSNKANLLALLMVFLIYISAVHALLINSEIEKKEKQESIVLIKKLAEEKDPVAEYLFSEVQQRIIDDTSLNVLLSSYWDKKEKIDQYIIDSYFDGYWDKYQLAITYCDLDDSLYINDWGTTVPCFEYFQDIIRREGDIISANNLFQLQNLVGRVDYVSEIPLLQTKNGGKLFIELGSNLFNENEGYPELLIDKESNRFDLNFDKFSYAVYNNDDLIFKKGEYNYSTKLRVNELSDSAFYRYKTQLFHHLVYQKDSETAIVLSKRELTLLDLLTSVAYLLISYALIYMILSLSFKNFIFDHQVNLRDFTVKMQMFLILSLLSALFLLALGTTYYIKEQYKLKNESHIREKIRSVTIELENKIASEEFLSDGLREVVQMYLVKFSNVFYSDINFYNKEGVLYSSSRQEVFDKGLKSRRMHPKAFKELVINQKAEWVQSEKIGELEYTSVYIPFKNYENELLGYLNLPYFARQGELEKEISTFLVSTINIYIGIFALALLVSILLANQISKPLLLIRREIRKLKLGSSIELIEWDSKDEIGALVKEYNRMTIELSQSAEQLAQSEREGAWREMAKQVAHEIKNPLTPMRLSIQHLQRSVETNSHDIKERIDRTAQTLIEQIEALTNIASAFSSFAQLPETIISKIDLIQTIRNTVGLYSNDVEITLEYEKDGTEYSVQADKDQLLRLFNNLIKNAVQATEETKNARINISVKKVEGQYRILVMDNGIGIDEGQIGRIFEPNFTTKSSGTGLGLAMSKSIVEQMGGTIDVQSKINEGTSFIISLPIA